MKRNEEEGKDMKNNKKDSIELRKREGQKNNLSILTL